jgi:uncharacterized protein (DUF488 family)
MPTVYAIGHSTRTIDDLIETSGTFDLDACGYRNSSPDNPQFNEDELQRSLEGKGITYMHFRELGGLRKAKKDSVNTGWQNASFRGFADYMQTREFACAIRKLMQLARQDHVAIMCAEGTRSDAIARSWRTL